jgi:hypothetical protein
MIFRKEQREYLGSLQEQFPFPLTNVVLNYYLINYLRIYY